MYEPAPVAVNVVELPLHIERLLPAFTIGLGFTVTVIIPVSVQPLASVPVTTYAVVLAGVAIGLAQLVHDNPAEGVHV